MAKTSSGYGLVPVKNADGSPYCGARNAYLMDPAGTSENIGFGTLVMLGSTGFVSRATGTGADAGSNNFGGTDIGALGVFVGCEYVNSVGQLIFDQHYPTGTVAAAGSVIRAYVVDDPGVTFQVQASGQVAQTELGNNFDFAAQQHATTSVNTTTGKSNMQVDPAGQTATRGFKCVGFSDRPGSTINDSFTDILVKINLPYHQFGTGVVSN
jgi:hypothetical protein